MTSLAKVKIGEKVQIKEFLDTNIRCFSARFGIEAGQIITCIAKPGPVVIRKNQQEIAIGKDLSNQILVKIVK